MSKCILFGHKWQNVPGAGKYTGMTFIVCAECNLVAETDRYRIPGVNVPDPDTPAAEERLANYEWDQSWPI